MTKIKDSTITRKLQCKTAPMYNGGQNYITGDLHRKKSKYSICIDYFDVTIEVSEKSLSTHLCFAEETPNSVKIGDFDLERSVYGSKYYKDIFKVYYHGEPFGNIQMNPRDKSGKILKGNWCQFKYDNHKLYQCDFISEFTEFLSQIDAKVRSYTRIDIALDGRDILDIYRGFEQGQYDRVGKCDYVDYKGYVDGKDRVISGVDWGRKKGDKYMTMYMKGRRIDQENKSYIKEYWRKNNIWDGSENGYKNIERAELKLKSKAVKKVKGFDYKKLNEPGYLASCMRTHFKKWFEFVEKFEGNISRADRIEFIDWNSINGELLPVDSTKPSNEVWSAKITIKKLYFSTKKGNLPSVTWDIISGLIGQHDLFNWYHKVRKGWDDKLKIPIVTLIS